MALDGIVIRAVTHELQSCVGARIHKIQQPGDRELVLHIRGGGTNGKLLISANPTYPRLHWTRQTFVNPLEAPMFCMLLRKHCEGGWIESIRQVGNERIVHFNIRQRDELGDLSLKTIVVELMGRHSNIILLNPATGAIHDGIHHVTPAISSYRVVLPGARYIAPPDQGKTDPLAVDSERSFAACLKPLAENGDMPAERMLVAAFSGFSPLIAREIAHRAGVAPGEPAAPERLWPAFARTLEDIRMHRYEPVIVDAEGGKRLFSAIALTHAEGRRETYASISECLEAYYGDKAERDAVKQRAADLIRFIQNEKAKNEKKIEKLQETLEEAKDADKYRIIGELITAYMHQLRQGDSRAELINYYDEEQRPVVVELDPQLTPSENAQRYFRRYAKHRNSLAVVTEQIERTREEIEYLAALLQQLDTASLADIEEIREELVEQGYIRDRGKRGPKRKKPARPALLCYTSSEGATIYVGKNNTQNEYLTNRLASPGDTWLHTKDIPGSHVVIRGDGFGETTLEEAAMLAAYYSQARESSRVPVDYTLIRHVRKPNGAKPGFVIYDNQKTLFVTPDEQRIRSLPSVIRT